MNMSKRKASRGIWIIAGLTVLGGLGAYAKMQGNKVPEAEMRTERAPQHRTPSVKAPDTQVKKDKTSVEIVRVDYQSENYKVDRDTRELETGQSPYLVAVNASLAHVDAVPAGAVATSAKFSDGKLALDFAAPFRRTYGTAEEGEIIQTILESLKQFKDVKSVLITEGGKSIETLGSVELTEPLEVTH